MDPTLSTPGHEQLLAIYERMTDGILVIDPEGVILSANPAARQLFGPSSTPLEGETFGHPIADGAAVIIELLGVGGQVRTAEMRVSDVDWNGRSATLLILRDVTERTHLLDRLHNLANYDAVTGLPNRTLFFEHLEQAIREARRPGRRVALLFIDVDGFKQVNDTFGHDVGDEFLKQIGERMKGALRDGDSVARFAGDEFLVTLTQVENTEEGSVVADKLLAALGDPFEVDGNVVEMGASIGVAYFPDDAQDSEALLRYADRAMYAAKRAGGRSFRRFEAHE